MNKTLAVEYNYQHESWLVNAMCVIVDPHTLYTEILFKKNILQNL